MKKIIFLLFVIPSISFSSNSKHDLNQLNDVINVEENLDDCKFSYTLELKQHSGVFSCPYLGPKIDDKLNEMDACNISKDKEKLMISFELGSITVEEDIETLFFKTIGIAAGSIINIKIIEIEK